MSRVDRMSNYKWLVVFRKEVRDGLRDHRSLFSALTFCWLGPLLVGVLWKQPTALVLLPAFLIITAFTGAMNIANDTMAGERERGSLEPLLMNPVALSDLVFGKFLATCAFSLGCVVLTLLFALAVLYATPLGGRMHPGALLWMFAVAVPSVPFAAGIDLLICTFAQTPKEGNSYLSVALLAPMLIGILAEFFPIRLEAAIAVVPLLGQQRMLSALTRGEIPHLSWLLLSGACTMLIGALAVTAAARLLQNEKVVFAR
jgi:sodium transport system permease protein